MGLFTSGQNDEDTPSLKDLPDWIAEHRFQQKEQLAAQPVNVRVLRDGKPVRLRQDTHHTSTLHTNVLDERAASSTSTSFSFAGLRFPRQRDTTRHLPIETPSPDEDTAAMGQEPEDLEEDVFSYDVDYAAYEPVDTLLDINSSGSSSAGKPPDDTVVFANDAVLLKSSAGSLHFCSAIIQRFARDAKANLLTLDVEDISDLCQHVYQQDGDGDHWSRGDLQGYATSLRTPSLEDFPVRELIANDVNARLNASSSKARLPTTPLIIHIHEVRDVVEVHGVPFLRNLCAAIAEERPPGSSIVFLTTAPRPETQLKGLASKECQCGSCEGNYPPQEVTDRGKAVLHLPQDRKSHPPADYDTHNEDGLLKAVGDNPRTQPIHIDPVSSPTQVALLEVYRDAECSRIDHNIRGLKRWLRQRSPEYHALDLLQPFTSWDFLAGTETVEKYWAKQPMDLGSLAGEVLDVMHENLLQDSILHIDCSRITQIQRQDDRKVRAAQLKQSHKYGLSLSVKDIMRTIRDMGSNWEQTMLDCVVDHEAIDEGWDDIAVDTEVKETMARVLGLKGSQNDVTKYGLLKLTGVRGAILYGPPGTGKTHLARVLAHESRATMMSVSASQISSKWHGESEQAIEALFNVARKLSPCIIFMDEADGVFRRRSSVDAGWQRAIQNQMLAELDGLNRSSRRLLSYWPRTSLVTWTTLFTDVSLHASTLAFRHYC